MEGFQIKKAAFVTSVVRYQAFAQQGLVEIAVAGKSNVGKSSLINTLCRNKKLARVSGEPGKTRLLNIYSLNEQMYLVDLPGYGYARVAKGEKEKWGLMIEDYLQNSIHLKRVFLLVDIRHDPTKDDCQMMDWLRASGLPFRIIATKADKISRGARMKHIAAICRSLVVQPWEVIPYSSHDGTGKDEVLTAIGEALEEQESDIES